MLPFPNEILMLGSVHEDKDYIFQFPCMGIKEGTCPQEENVSRSDIFVTLEMVNRGRTFPTISFPIAS